MGKCSQPVTRVQFARNLIFINMKIKKKKKRVFLICDLQLWLSKKELFPSEDFPQDLIPMHHFHARYLSLIDLIDM